MNTRYEFLHALEEETGSDEFLQPCSVVAVGILHEIATAVISAVLSLDEKLSQTHNSCVPKCCCRSVCCLIRFFLVGVRIAKCFTGSSK
jgi:hypothetical protein